jgi:predicted dienelactone hydrolase
MLRLAPVALVLVVAQNAPTPVTFELPAPTGPSPVGTTRWLVTDTTRRETFASNGMPRQLAVVAWYPAAAPLKGAPAPYLREGLVEAQAFSRLFFRGQPTGFDALAAVRTHAAVDAPPAPGPAQLPVLLFSHGYTGVPSAHTALLEDLASYGYVVLSVVHPYEATGTTLDGGREVTMLDATGAPRQEIREVFDEWSTEDAVMTAVTAATAEAEQRRLLRGYLDTLANTTRVVQRWTADTRAVLDQLPLLDPITPAGRVARRVDASRVGAVGHSMGGVTAGQFCLEDKRCRAAANLDGIPQYGSMFDAGLGRPFLMVYSARRGRMGANDAIYRPAATPYTRADVAGTLHLDFTDMAFWTPLRERKALGEIDPLQATAITRRVVREFFDQELRGRRSALLERTDTMAGVTVRTLR